MSNTLQGIVVIIPGHFYTNDRAFRAKGFVQSQQLLISKLFGRQPGQYILFGIG